MDSEPLDRQVDTLKTHQLTTAIIRYHDDVSAPPGATMRVKYFDENDKNFFPTFEIDYGELDQEAIKASEKANALIICIDTLFDTLQKAILAVSEVENVKVVSFSGIRQLDYHIENFYIRLPILLEQTHFVAALLFDIVDTTPLPLWKIEKRLHRMAPRAGAATRIIATRLRAIKARRNEVAHTGAFSDDRLVGVRAHLGTLERMDPEMDFRERNRELLPAIERFQSQFLVEALTDIESVAKGIVVTFDELWACRAHILTTRWDRSKATGSSETVGRG